MRSTEDNGMYIRRDFEPIFERTIRSGKVLVVYGSRQTGKTTVIQKVLETPDIQSGRIVQLSGDVKAHRDLLSYAAMTPEKARSMIGKAQTLFVDEAQKILDIGLTLKIIHDLLGDVRLVATGSSSFALSSEVGEPLTGRMASFVLPPLSYHELAEASSGAAETSLLETRLRLGSYPEIVTASTEEEAVEMLGQLCESYLFKDILTWQDIRHSDMLDKLLRALALQMGSEVSYKEVGDIVGIDNETAKSYIERLEKSYVLFRLPAFSRNLRNELKRARKIYFCDTGVRNAVLENFLALDRRDDVGALFENYLVCERRKHNNVTRRKVRTYFWRTTTPSDGEIDFIEESADGAVAAYEFKWNPAKAAKAKCPRSFSAAYPGARWTVVSRDNYPLFVTGRI